MTTTQLSGKTILITGGGSGLGAAMANAFCAFGAKVIICGRRQEPLARTAADIKYVRPNSSVQFLRCDIRDPDAVASVCDEIWAIGGIDALVNNAAATFLAETHRLSHRAIDAVLETTLHGTIYCTLEIAKRWIEEKRKGSILNILSPTVRTGRPFTVPSVVAKAGILGLTRSLAVEWGQYGIRINGIEPGTFPTEGATKQLGGASRQPPERRIPLGRVGQHIEVATLAAYLLSDAASFITGESIAIDGGAHLRTSGAEDLLEWTAAEWEAFRAQR